MRVASPRDERGGKRRAGFLESSARFFLSPARDASQASGVAKTASRFVSLTWSAMAGKSRSLRLTDVSRYWRCCPNSSISVVSSPIWTMESVLESLTDRFATRLSSYTDRPHALSPVSPTLDRSDSLPLGLIAGGMREPALDF